MSDERSTTISKTPTSISFRDLILVMAAVVSIVAAWGMYGTRLSITEEKLRVINYNLTDIKQTLKDIRRDGKAYDAETQHQIDALDARLRHLEERQVRIESSIKQRKIK